MTAIATFTLTAPNQDAPRTEATLFELSATQTTDGGLVIPGFSDVQVKEASVRLRSGLGIGLPLNARIKVTGPAIVEPGKLTLPGYSTASALDLPLALALLGMGDEVAGLAVAGELGMDGSVRPVRGILAMTLAAKRAGLRGVVVPFDNVGEALAVVGMEVHGVAHVDSVSPSVARRGHRSVLALHTSDLPQRVDFADVRGNAAAVASLAACVRDGSDVVLSGPPSTATTMLARRATTIMKPMTPEQQIELTKAYSALGLARRLLTERPFRAPHHTISAAALLGSNGRPGEIHLAAYGVLLLDEVQSFTVEALAGLRLALERMGAARPMVVCTVNAAWGPGRTAVANRAIATLGAKVVPIEVELVPLTEMQSHVIGESSRAIRDRIWAVPSSTAPVAP